jgi:tetraacyldisaccharide-1-P 4'-kinase
MKSNNGNIVMGVTSKDESVEELIKKLNERGTKVKIVNDDEVSNQTPKQRTSVKKEKLKSPNDSTKSHKESNKENKPEATKTEAVVDETEKKRLEELKKQNEEISQIKDQ